jgi:hypothetical protein
MAAARGQSGIMVWQDGMAGPCDRRARPARSHGARASRELRVSSIDRDRDGCDCNRQHRKRGREHRHARGERARQPADAGFERRPRRHSGDVDVQRSLRSRKGSGPSEATGAARPTLRPPPAFRPSAGRGPQPAKGVHGESTRTYATPALRSPTGNAIPFSACRHWFGSCCLPCGETKSRYVAVAPPRPYAQGRAA